MKYLLTLVALIWAVGVEAQTSISGGLKAGLSMSKFWEKSASPDEDNALGSGWKIGPQIGGYLQLQLSDKIYLQPELFIDSKGAKLDANNASRPWNMYFVTLPIMLGINLTEQASVQVGAQYSNHLFTRTDGQKTTFSNFRY